MKKKLKQIILISIFTLIVILTRNVYAATASIAATKTSAYVGDTVNVNVSINAASWNLNIGGSGISGGKITGFNMEGVNQATSKSYSLNTSSAGTYVISLTGDISDGSTDVTSDISKTVTVTIKTKPVTKPSTNTTTTTKPLTSTTTKKPTTGTTINKNTTTNTTNTVNTLSSNAYLSQFRIDQPGITPSFSKTIYNYSVTVGEDVNKISVTAVPEHSKATVVISGNTNLKVGDNSIIVRVTSQDKKNVKTYKIIVTKADDPEKSNAYLQSLFISDIALTPEFSSEVFEYDLGIIANSVNKLDIAAFPVNEKAKVDIIGNDNLVIGENTIKVIVTSENGKTQKTYTLKVNKEEANSLVNIDSEGDKELEINNGSQTISVIGETLKEKSDVLFLYALVWIEFIQVVYLYEKLKKIEKSKEVVKKDNKK